MPHNELYSNGHNETLWVEKVISGKPFFDWNSEAVERNVCIGDPDIGQLMGVQIRDESFRDALGTANRIPSVEERKSIITLLNDLGIDFVTLDIFSSPNRELLSESNQETLRLLRWMKQEEIGLDPVILARANENDIDFLKQAYQINDKLIGIIFQDLSEVRRMVEGWGSLDTVLDGLCRQIRTAKQHGIRVMAFTENLSITTPEDVQKYVKAVCEAGADWVGIADTAGRLRPRGAALLTSFVKEQIEEYKTESGDDREIGIVFHGHDDLHNAIANSIDAITSGASVIDVVINGLGERVGNTNLGVLVANIEAAIRATGGKDRFDLTKLNLLSELYGEYTQTQAGSQQPLVGEKVFSTSFGIHASFYYKVEVIALNLMDELDERGNRRYSDEDVWDFRVNAWKVYSALSPADVGREPDIRVNSNSGAANVILRLKQLGVVGDVRKVNKYDMAVQEILNRAKKESGEVDDGVIVQIWQSYNPDRDE